MKIALEDHHHEHCRKVGVLSPDVLRCSEEEYTAAQKLWKHVFSGEELKKRAIAHILCKREAQRKAKPSAPVVVVAHAQGWLGLAERLGPFLAVALILLALSIHGHCQFSHINTITVTDSTHTEFAASPFTITFTGCTVGGTGTNMTVTCSGGGSQTWPSTPGITVCTGTPCSAWGTSFNSTNAVFANWGGTSRNTLDANAVLIGNGTGPVNFADPNTQGYVLTDQGGAGNDPLMLPSKNFIDVTRNLVITPGAYDSSAYLDCNPSSCTAISIADGIYDGELLNITCSSYQSSTSTAWIVTGDFNAFGQINLGGPGLVNPALGSYDNGTTSVDVSQTSCGAVLMWSNTNGVWELLNLYGGTTS